MTTDKQGSTMNQYSPTNTSTQDPMITLMGLLGDPSGGIEAQEAQGQRELLNSTTLPTDMGLDGQAAFEALGFTFGDEVAGDPLFREATLPDGWSRKGSDHAMHSTIVDERGLERVGVFYKAAFYDRHAAMHVVNVGGRISSHFIYGDDETFSIPDGLSADEATEMEASAHGYVENARRSPAVYGDRLPRAEQILAAIRAKDDA